MHKVACIVIVSVTLAAHATRAMLVQGVKIQVNYFLGRLLPARRHRKGHYIPYHKAYSFWFSTAGIYMAAVKEKMLPEGQHLG